MDGLLPPVIEEVFDQSDEPCDLKEEKATILESLMAEEKDGGMAADGDKDQEKEVTEEKGRESEELDWEELGAQLFHILLELEEAREVSLRYQEDYQDLQGQLEEERFVSAEQAETFSRQIQSLKDQLCSVQEQKQSLQEQRKLELRSAQEEVLLLQRSAQEAAEEREDDIAALQEELCRLGAQLQHLLLTLQEDHLEVIALRAQTGLKSQSQDLNLGDILQLKDNVSALRDERATLSRSNVELLARLERLQTDSKCEDTSSTVRAQDIALTSTICGSELEALKVQLRRAQEKVERVQNQSDRLKDELKELQLSCNGILQEQELLEVELQRCRAELHLLVDEKSQTGTCPSESPILSFPFMGLVVMVALVWCWWEELASSQSKTQSWDLVVGAVATVAMAAVAILVIPSLSRA